MNKKTLIIAQILMTFLMALSMSGIMSAMALGLTRQWLAVWPQQFLIAWPVAFALTLLATRIAFPLAARLGRLI